MRNVITVQWSPPAAAVAPPSPCAAALVNQRPVLTKCALWLFGYPDPARALVDAVLDEAARDLNFMADAGAVRADVLARFRRHAVARLRDRARVSPLHDDSDEHGEDAEPLFHADGRWCDAPTARDPDDEPDATGLHAVLARGVDALPRHTACLVVLREVLGLTAREIAAAVQLPLPVCRTMLCRARLRLHQRMQREWTAVRRGG